MTTLEVYRKFYISADRIYRQHRPGPDAWHKHQQHLKNADTLLFLELPQKAAAEFKLALEALQQRTARTSTQEVL